MKCQQLERIVEIGPIEMGGILCPDRRSAEKDGCEDKQEYEREFTFAKHEVPP